MNVVGLIMLWCKKKEFFKAFYHFANIFQEKTGLDCHHSSTNYYSWSNNNMTSHRVMPLISYTPQPLCNGPGGEQILPSTSKNTPVMSQHSKGLELILQHSRNFQCVDFGKFFL